MSRDFSRLLVWQRAHRVAIEVYEATRTTSRREYGALVSQMRRAAASVPANIAEGCGRDGSREFARYLQIAMASASELEYHLWLAVDIHALPSHRGAALRSEVQQVKRMLTALLRRVRTGDAHTARSDG